MKTIAFLLSSILLLFACHLQAQTGDNCSNAINLATQTSPYTGTTIGFADDFNSSCVTTASDMIFYIDVPADNILVIGQTTNNYDSKNLVAYGGTCPGNNTIICWDDSDTQTHYWQNSTGAQQRVWWIQDGYDGNEIGNFTLAWSIVQPPPNDECSDAIQVDCGQTISGQTILSTIDDVPGCVYSFGTSGGIWYQITGNGNLVSLGLCNSDYDTKIGVFTGSCNGLECITGDDDGCISPNSLGSYVEFNSLVNTTYYILVTGYSSYTGSFELSVDCDISLANDLAVTQFINPVTSCEFTPPQQVQMEILNEGTAPQSNFDVGYIVNGSSTTSTFFGTVQPGESAIYTFPQSLDLSAVGTYDFQVFTDLAGDQNAFNDTLVTSVEHLPPLDINITGEESICPGDYVLLEADYNFNYQYEWNTGSTYYIIADYPIETTTYTVTVTDLATPGCVDVASFTLEVLEEPEVPVAFASSNVICPGSSVTITVQNLTENLLWSTGESGPSITVTQAGWYQVTHVGDNGCSSVSQWVFVNSESIPYIYTWGDAVICGQESETLQASFGTAFEWSTGETTQYISVMPDVTTNYSVTVTTANNCIHILGQIITVASDAPPGGVSDMLPPDGAQNVSLPVQFSWSPADNATHYEVYIWNINDQEPPNPTLTTTQITFPYYGSLQYANTYKWKVCARNDCSTDAPVCSIIQKFTLNELPDLVVDSIFAPQTAFSGTELPIDWVIKNNGNGSTNDISNNATWYDVCYLSPDSVLGGNDIYLGGLANPTALQPGNSYTTSAPLVADLPNGIEGEHFVIVCTDRYNYMPESDELNNCRISIEPIDIQLTPPPDLVVDPEPLLIGLGGGVVSAGQSFEVKWTVVNRENGLNSGPTLSAWWYDRVYLSADTILNLQTAQLQATIRHDGNLGVEMSYDTSAMVYIPADAEDTLYVFVCTDATNREYEYIFENNNCNRSSPLTVISIPKPDFFVDNIAVVDTASNKENITVSWDRKNDGADFTGSLTDRIYISNQPDFSDWYQPLANLSQYHNPLANGGSSPVQKTIQIPANITGKYYLLVQTNPGNNINEFDFTNNVGVDSIYIISPNLIVSDITPLPDAVSGQTITFEWELANIGAGDLLSYSVSDRIRLIEVNSLGDSLTTYQPGNLTLFSGGTQSRQKTLTLPFGLSGDYYIEVYTNYNNSAYENGLYDDNISMTSEVFHIEMLSDFPNLIADSVSAATSTATAGDMIDISFRVENGGNAAASGIWADRVYLSTEPVWPISSYLVLDDILHSQVVLQGGHYEKTFTAQLPTYLAASDYYLYLKTDVGNGIFENNLEADNLVRSVEPINISIYPLVDLRFVGSPVGPPSITPGQTASVYYEVENNGTVATATDIWKDGLYLSPNTSWDPSDVLIAEWQRNGALNAGQSYEMLENFTLPAGFTDAFYLCLVIDHENVVPEVNEDNNFVKILQSNGDTITINYPPKPDLQVDTLILPANGIAGQPLNISYIIRNASTEGDAEGTWTESVYLSTDPNLSFGDELLGQKNYSNGLGTGDFYEEDMEVTLPLGISGNYYLLIKTDAGNLIAEEDETNNVKSQYLLIVQPAPGDLFVVKDDIIAPPLDTIATDITISWRVKNIGQNPLYGFMKQGVYLSENDVWDASDILLDTWSGTIGLDPNASATHSLTARLENVKRQDYHVFVKTDLLDHFLEDDETNNCSSGPATVFIEVPELPIGYPVTPAIAELERSIYYRIEIPNDTIGETMRVSITGLSDSTAFNELYLRRNNIPTRTIHDFSFGAPFEESQEIIVPAVESGTYYVMAYTVDGLPVQDVELLAEIIPFQITSINANKGGNTGAVTALLKGAKFESGMTVRLEKTGSPTIQAQNVALVNASSAFVTFPLAGVEIGFYNVIASSNGDQDTLINGFEVLTGTVGNGPLLVGCAIDLGDQLLSLTNVPDSIEVLFFEPSHPSTVRPNQVVPITLRFENTGDVDVPTPARIFASINGFPLSESTGGIAENLEELPLTFIEENGPENVLRPGGVAFITVYSKATQSEGVLKFKLFSN